MSLLAACSYCPSYSMSPSGEGIDKDSKIMDECVQKMIDDFRGWSVTFGRRLEEAQNSLLEIVKESSSTNWDGYGALPITREALEEAEKIIHLLPSSIRMPEILAEPTGEIGLEWHVSKGRVFVLSVGGRHRITYAGIFGTVKVHDTVYFEETLPSVIIEHLRELNL